ncbi:class I SAM-dependent rRNA methyltransferase [Halalkalibacterium ligniniphilum]|uniref:class I SAM-dependent rRNA methyltransferase n=1 Tax=Halalkalibacterium ligniniphilum TaxID=1134413 RepID=UPI000345C691|nr:class I SAM-dependent rRNA methyltransferase [Halalkalibacterium ligniniphilum]
MSEAVLHIKAAYQKRVKGGYPLLLKEAIKNEHDLQKEGTVVEVLDEQNQFIGRGFIGKQNKGVGWILTRNRDERIDERFFEKKLSAAFNQRKRLFQDPDTTAFRVFNGEGDGIGGLIIDYFDGYYVIQWYSEGIYSFKEYVIKALDAIASYTGIYEKKRFNTDGQYIDDDDFVEGERGEFPLAVKENGIHFAVYLNDGAMVGVFLDQKDVRKTIRDKYSKGKNVLNTFSYTGAFSVAAALGGAAKTTSVDLAKRSHRKTIEQFSMNGIDYEAHDIVVMDVFKYFNYAAKKKWVFDLVILDPPSFARSKKHTFSAAKDYKNLLKEAIAVTEANGVIVASTNHSGVDMKKFKGFIDKAFQETGRSYQVLEEHSLPQDFRTNKQFPEGDYLKVVFVKKLGK